MPRADVGGDDFTFFSVVVRLLHVSILFSLYDNLQIVAFDSIPFDWKFS